MSDTKSWEYSPSHSELFFTFVSDLAASVWGQREIEKQTRAAKKRATRDIEAVIEPVVESDEAPVAAPKQQLQEVDSNTQPKRLRTQAPVQSAKDIAKDYGPRYSTTRTRTRGTRNCDENN
jgi:hypothetical protein